MNFIFGHTRPPTTELAALERLKYSFDHSSTFIFHLIFFILVGNQDIHESMDEFEFRSNPITDYGALEHLKLLFHQVSSAIFIQII